MKKLKLTRLKALILTIIFVNSLIMITSPQAISSSQVNEYPVEESIQQGILDRQPPENWDPTLASDEELAYYGHPQRPSDPKELSEWNIRFKGNKHVKPHLESRTDIELSNNPLGNETAVIESPNSSSNIVTSGTNTPPAATTSPNWGGYYKIGNFTHSESMFNVPVLSAPPDTTYSLAIWAGLGGVEAPLMQAGVLLKEYPTYTERFLFLEMIGTNYSRDGIMQVIQYEELPGLFNPIPVMEGDVILAKVTYLTDYLAQFYVLNDTQNIDAYIPISFSGFTKSGNVRATADWIFERPVHDGNIGYFLPSWSNYFGDWNNFYTPVSGSLTRMYNDPTVHKLNICDDNRTHTLAYCSTLNPGGGDSSSFRCYWLDYN